MNEVTKTRYDKVKEILDSLPEESLRICQSKNGCACRGCVTSLDIRKSEFVWWLENHYGMKPLSFSIPNANGYLFDEKGYPIGTK